MLVYFASLLIFACGLFMMISSDNYIAKIIGLGIFQNAVLIFYLAIGKVKNGLPPIINLHLAKNYQSYSSPLPHVLMLTAIVVGFATLATGLSLIARIYQEFNSVSEDIVQSKMDDYVD